MEDLNQLPAEFQDIIPSDYFKTKYSKIKSLNQDFLENQTTNNDTTYIQSNLNVNKFKPYLSSDDDYKYDEFLYLDKKLEEVHKVKVNYLKSQNELSYKKRFILLDWIMEVCYQFHFWRKTYFSCINLIDIFFTKCKVPTDQIQLVGIACLLISAKNEETEIPQISYFSLATENYYSKSDILKKESEILQILKWKIQYVDVLDVINIFALKWDEIIQLFNKEQSIEDDKMPVFRNDPKYKDLLLVHLYHFLDYLSLDYYFNFYNEKYLCVAITYIIVGVVKNIFSYKDAFYSFNKNKLFNNEKVMKYKKHFFDICEKYLKINIVNILDYLKYVCVFSGIIFDSSSDNANKSINTKDEKNIQLQKYDNHNFDTYKKLEKLRKENYIN